MIARFRSASAHAKIAMLAILVGISAASAQVNKVARPNATPAVQEFSAPFSVSLTTPTPGTSIFYTLDGTIPDTAAGGATHKYAGPIAITGTIQIKAIATKAGEGWYPSDVVTLVYTLIPPNAPDHGWYLDADGDGRIERAIVLFPKDLAVIPAKLGFVIQDPSGATLQRTVEGEEIWFQTGSKSRIETVFSEAFPYGVTALKNVATSGRTFVQNDIPILDAVFPMYDSVPPVILRAEVLDPSPSSPYPTVKVTVSEPVRTLSSFLRAFRFLSPGRGIDSILGLRSNPSVGPDESEITLRLDPDSRFAPGAGDSIGLVTDGTITDMSMNVPKSVNFIAFTGAQVGIFHDRFGRSAVRKPSLNAAWSITCYSLKGSWLGKAKPSAVPGTWELPGGEQARILRLDLAEGTSR